MLREPNLGFQIVWEPVLDSCKKIVDAGESKAHAEEDLVGHDRRHTLLKRYGIKFVFRLIKVGILDLSFCIQDIFPYKVSRGLFEHQ